MWIDAYPRCIYICFQFSTPFRSFCSMGECFFLHSISLRFSFVRANASINKNAVFFCHDCTLTMTGIKSLMVSIELNCKRVQMQMQRIVEWWPYSCLTSFYFFFAAIAANSKRIRLPMLTSVDWGNDCPPESWIMCVIDIQHRFKWISLSWNTTS